MPKPQYLCLTEAALTALLFIRFSPGFAGYIFINNEMYLHHYFLEPRGYLCSTSLNMNIFAAIVRIPMGVSALGLERKTCLVRDLLFIIGGGDGSKLSKIGFFSQTPSLFARIFRRPPSNCQKIFVDPSSLPYISSVCRSRNT